MPRIRTIKPEFWTNEQVIELSIAARLLFVGTWNFCDDQGVMPASLKALKAKVLPADDFSAADIQQLIDELLSQGLLGEFEAQDARWWYVTGWKHQKIDRPTPSKYPEPPSTRRSAGRPLPSEGAGDDPVSRMSRAHSSADTDALAEDSASRSRAHSSAAEQDTAPVDDDSTSVRRAFDEDSPQGKDRKGKDRIGASSSSSSRARRADGRTAAGCRLPFEALPDDWRAWCETETPTLNAETTFDRFRDYWIAVPGQKACKANWLATWRNWCRTEAERNATRTGHEASKQAGPHGHESAHERRKRINLELIEGARQHFG